MNIHINLYRLKGTLKRLPALHLLISPVADIPIDYLVLEPENY